MQSVQELSTVRHKKANRNSTIGFLMWTILFHYYDVYKENNGSLSIAGATLFALRQDCLVSI